MCFNGIIPKDSGIKILDLLDKDLKAISINEPSMKWELAIIWRKDIIVDSLTKNWIKFIQENYLLHH